MQHRVVEVFCDLPPASFASFFTCPAPRPYLTGRMYRLVLESQLPHKVVKLLFTTTNQHIKLTVLWGS